MACRGHQLLKGRGVVVLQWQAKSSLPGCNRLSPHPVLRAIQEMRSKKESESPTQYYLTELGLDLEWQNSLLQFGPNVWSSFPGLPRGH